MEGNDLSLGRQGCSPPFFNVLQELQCGLYAILRHEQHSALHADADAHNDRWNIRAL